jgi:hypothetical protein
MPAKEDRSRSHSSNSSKGSGTNKKKAEKKGKKNENQDKKKRNKFKKKGRDSAQLAVGLLAAACASFGALPQAESCISLPHQAFNAEVDYSYNHTYRIENQTEWSGYGFSNDINSVSNISTNETSVSQVNPFSYLMASMFYAMNATTARSVSFDRPARRMAGRHDVKNKPSEVRMGKSTHDAKTDTQFMDMMMGRAYEKAFDLAREVDVVKGSDSCAKTRDTFFRVVKKSSFPPPPGAQCW